MGHGCCSGVKLEDEFPCRGADILDWVSLLEGTCNINGGYNDLVDWGLDIDTVEESFNRRRMFVQ